MSTATINFGEGIPALSTDELPEAVLEDNEWHVGGSVIEDDTPDEMFDTVQNYLAILLAKNREAARLVKVATLLNNRFGGGNKPAFSFFDRKSYGYAFWLNQARDVVDLVEELSE